MSGIGNFINGIVQWFVGSTQYVLRRFVVYSLLLFFIGIASGVMLYQKSQFAEISWYIVFAPLILAFLAYLYTEIAALIFLLGVFLLFFLVFI